MATTRISGLAVLIVALVTQLISAADLEGEFTRRFANEGAMRLSTPASYFIAAPRRVRPDQEVRLFVSVISLPYETMTIRAIITKDTEEYAAAREVFLEPSTRTMALKMPSNAQDGNYSLTVEGYTSEGRTGLIFSNQTKLEFQQKHVSVFITTDKMIYYKKSTVHYRVYAVLPNLLPVPGGTVDIYVRDGGGRIARRWLFQQLRNGYFEGSIPTAHPAKHGTWTIEVRGWGTTYTKNFVTNNFFATKFHVNITMPNSILDTDFGLGGMIVSNLTYSGVAVRGNISLQLEVIPPASGEAETETQIIRNYTLINGHLSFLFPLSEVVRYTTQLAGTKLVLRATVFDWYALESKTAIAYCWIYPSEHSIRFVGGKVRTFKPGSPLKAYVAVYAPDGGRMDRKFFTQVLIQVVVTKRNGLTQEMEQRGHVIPDDSIVRYTYWTQADDDTVTIRATYSGHRGEAEQLVATRTYSESPHFIYVTSSTLGVAINQYVVFTVRTTIHVETVQYMIISAGNIVTTTTLYMTSLQKTFSLASSRDMLPDATILVYTVLTNGEVLADSLTFHVHGLTGDGVKVKVNQGKDFTRDKMEFTGITDPGTFMTFAAEDYDFYQRGYHSNFLSIADVEEDLATYAGSGNSSFRQTWYKPAARRSQQYFQAPCSAIDANETFQFAGLTVFTDANLVRMPAVEACNFTRGYMACYDGSCYAFDQRCDGFWQCADGADEMGCPIPDGVVRHDDFSNFHLTWNHFDDRLWGWQSHYTMPYGRIDLPVAVPLRPATWLVQGVALSTTNGLMFNEEPTRLDTTRPFYIEVEMPRSSFRGEQIGVQVAVFNYWNQPLETTLMLEDSSDYEFIHVEDWGLASSYSPRTRRGDVQIMVYLERNEGRFIHFPILPVIIGKVKVTIHAYSNIRHQKVTKTLTVDWDGVTNTWHTPHLIDMVNSGSLVIPHLEIPIPERFIVPEKREHLYVPGSGSATVSFVGDIVGPGFYDSHIAAGTVFEIVNGDCEHYLFDLGINAHWLRFLHQTNNLGTSTLQGALSGMNKDLQSVLAFIMADGGMAMRRSRKPSSVWMTSLALDVLSQAAYQEWEQDFFIDVTVLNRMALWLVQHQNETTGAFWEPVLVGDIRMTSNLTDDNGTPMNISLTAYAAIGLAKATPKLTGDAPGRAAKARDAAVGYLYRHLDVLSDPFDICLVTYAMYLSNHRSRTAASARMRAVARTDHLLYWSEESIPPLTTKIIDNLPYLAPRPMALPYQSKAIEASSYALMVYLMENNLKQSTPIMKWLQSQRFHHSGFDGPQDTLIAVQALIKWAETETNRDFYNMRLQMSATSSPGWSLLFDLDKSNILKYQKGSVPAVWGSVQSVAEGTGYGLLQLDSRVNVEYPWLMRQPQIRAFDLEVDTLRFHGRNASLFEMNVCVTWVATHIAPRSGAVILEVDIPTGYFVRKQELRIYQRAGRIHSQRSRYTQQKVVLYFDYLDDVRSCWYFPAERWYPVANGTIQHRIRVYDAFEPGLMNTTLFTTYELFHLHICRVCGSFQCPYCPHYNRATPITRHPHLGPLLLVLVSLLTQIVDRAT